ncbi:hypothetical protein ACNF40_04250 [Cuniculiplasma sp. SKW4]|uniref:hypothetical protein n=1 Tax=Cuniculiplasma sp. SKW4 TaxID=3400171 RepID=UPI003FD01106
MIEYRTKKKVNANTKECREILRSPKTVMEHGNVISSVESLDDGKYKVTFVWKRFGMSRTNVYEFRIEENDESVIYRGINSSKDSFMFQFTIYGDKDGNSIVSPTFQIATGYFRGDSIVKSEFIEEMNEMMNQGIHKIDDFDFTAIKKI